MGLLTSRSRFSCLSCLPAFAQASGRRGDPRVEEMGAKIMHRNQNENRVGRRLAARAAAAARPLVAAGAAGILAAAMLTAAVLAGAAPAGAALAPHKPAAAANPIRRLDRCRRSDPLTGRSLRRPRVLAGGTLPMRAAGPGTARRQGCTSFCPARTSLSFRPLRRVVCHSAPRRGLALTTLRVWLRRGRSMCGRRRVPRIAAYQATSLSARTLTVRGIRAGFRPMVGWPRARIR